MSRLTGTGLRGSHVRSNANHRTSGGVGVGVVGGDAVVKHPGSLFEKACVGIPMPSSRKPVDEHEAAAREGLAWTMARTGQRPGRLRLSHRQSWVEFYPDSPAYDMDVAFWEARAYPSLAVAWHVSGLSQVWHAKVLRHRQTTYGSPPVWEATKCECGKRWGKGEATP